LDDIFNIYKKSFFLKRINKSCQRVHGIELGFIKNVFVFHFDDVTKVPIIQGKKLAKIGNK
jgi:hypothetical protein